MTDHNAHEADPGIEFDEEAAAGLSDEGYMQADIDAMARNAGFNLEEGGSAG